MAGYLPGYSDTLTNISSSAGWQVRRHVMEAECGEVMRAFFRRRRREADAARAAARAGAGAPARAA